MLRLLSERVQLDLLRVLVLLAVVTSVTVLGIKDVLDAAAVTGVLGTVVGALGSQAGAAISERIRENVKADMRVTAANGGSAGE